MFSRFKLSGNYPCWHLHGYDKDSKIIFETHQSSPELCIRDAQKELDKSFWPDFWGWKHRRILYYELQNQIKEIEKGNLILN